MMYRDTNLRQSFLIKSMVTALALVALGSLLFVSALPQKAHAQTGIFACADLVGVGSLFGAGASAAGTVVPVLDGPALQKECLDSIAFSIAKATLEAIANDLLFWINSGFEGGPAFVTDLEEFLGLVDAEAFEEFLGSDAIAFICSPWRLDIEAALRLNIPQGNIPQCSLTDVVENIESFYDGTSNLGGWEEWAHLTLVPQNNPYGAYVIANATGDARIAAVRFENIKLLEFGEGFFSFPHCTTRPANPSDPGFNPGDTIEECEIATPGKVINQQLNNVLSSGTRQLELADEINEVITAFIAQLLNQTITQGLRSF